MNRPRRPLLTTVIAVSALVAAMQVAPAVGHGALPDADAASGPVSGAVGLGGGLSGSVDERTGLFSMSVPVAAVAGPGSAGVTWSLVWDQARASGGLDRSGFGPGWSLGVSFVDTGTPKRVYPANGGSYLVGGSFSSGLQDYPLKDLAFSQKGGANPYSLTYDGGKVDEFDADGNLVSRSDRFGNRTQFTWRSLGSGRWAPVTIVDGYGQTTTFTYTPAVNPKTVQVTAPPRADGVSATTTITLDEQHRVSSVTDPNTTLPSASASFQYASESNSLLTQVTSPTLARTHVAYQDIAYEPGLTAVRSVASTDALGTVLGPARYFSMNPLASAADKNYTGYPNHISGESDALFESGDPQYTYTTQISSCVIDQVPAPTECASPQASTRSTFDSKHRLVSRTVFAGGTPLQVQSSTYPPVQTVPVPGNYARPLTTQVTYQSASSAAGMVKASGSRTTQAKRAYDDHGRVTSSTDETGTTTVTVYDGTYGLVTGETVTGKDGSRSQTTRVLTADKKSISSATTAYAAPGQPLTPRSTTSYLYDAQGQPSQRTMTWAPGAKPSGASNGPDTVTTKFASAIDPAAHTRTITTTTAAGTPAAGSSQAVLDLVSGLPVRTVDALGRTTRYAYDAGGRQVGLTTPDGLTTRRTYAAATGGTPASYTDSTPDGRIVLTTLDALGRKVRVTDNVRDQAFTTAGTTRLLSTFSHSVDGTKLTAIDQLGRTSTTTLDSLGRQVEQVGPTGITKAASYDDAAHTATQTTTGAGLTSPAVTRTTGYDNGNRVVSLSRRYSDGIATDPTQATTYDGLGRVTTTSSDDLNLAYSYLTPGSTSTAQTVTPQDPKSYPGEPLSLASTEALGGQQTSSQRQETTGVGQPSPGNSNGNGKGKGGGSGAGQSDAAQGTRLTYDPAGRLVTSTDPDGRKTGFTYYADGTTATRTSPTGIVTTDTYDATSGRLTSVTAQAPGQAAITTAYTYVLAGQPGAGQVHTITEGSNTVTLAYDADRHVVSRSYSDGTATGAAYLDNGLLSSTTDVTGAVTSYGYDGLSRITSATQKRGSTELASVGYTYDAFSRIATTKRGNGVTTTNTFNSHNQVTGQSTTSASGGVLESHAYTYDSHGNVSTRIDTVPTVSATPATAGTWTSTYGYDAYDRLISSATYAGGNTAGQPATSTAYTLNVSGDVVSSATTTRTQQGAQRQDPPSKGNNGKDDNPHKKQQPPASSSPTPFTDKVVNTIDPAGQLITQTTDGTVVNQTFDGEGRVTQSLNATTANYDAYDRMTAATTKGGATTTYAYWPDGTRRSNSTSSGGATSTMTFHYGTDGTLANDSTADATTGSGATTASYLLTAGREARTLQPGTTPSGKAQLGAPAPVATGAGTGYLLRDRHSSVTALVDAAGSVTDSYEYTDYGAAAAQDGEPLPASSVVAGGRTNPFRYTGAAPISAMTDPATGLLLLPARSYDPTQGRFTSRDSANVFNHYQAFSTNPIRLVDVTGHLSGGDLFLEVAMVLVFIVTTVVGVLSGGLGFLAAPVVAEGAVAATAGEVASSVAASVGTFASGIGAVTSALMTADSIDNTVSGTHFLGASVRKGLGITEAVAGSLALVSALAGVGLTASAIEAADAAGAAEESSASVVDEEASSLPSEEPSSDEDVSGWGPEDARDMLRDRSAVDKRDAWDELDHVPDYTHLQSGEEIPDDPDLRSEGDETLRTASSFTKELGLDRGDDSVIKVNQDALDDRPKFLPKQTVARGAFGTENVDNTDPVVLRGDRGLDTALKASKQSIGSVSRRIDIRPLSAARGNWSAQAVNGNGNNPIAEILSYDDAGEGS